MHLIKQYAPQYKVKPTCRVLDVHPSSYYRWLEAQRHPKADRRRPPRKCSDEEEQQVLDLLSSERFMNESPTSMYATLLDEGMYICSERTMYRILERHKLLKKRQYQREHPVYTKPELLATGPNQVWSWDITKIKGPKSWISYHLYVVIDVYSRCVVAWTLSDHESGAQARALVDQACLDQGVQAAQLTIHSDRGKAMRSKTLTDLFGELGVSQSLSRPHVSNDNPYSESQFRTLKYRHNYPERFGSIEDALSFMRHFMEWYNTVHKHSGIGLLTPLTVHCGEAGPVIKKRLDVLDQAYQKHPERFVKGKPNPKRLQLPSEVWINKPKSEAA